MMQSGRNAVAALEHLGEQSQHNINFTGAWRNPKGTAKLQKPPICVVEHPKNALKRWNSQESAPSTPQQLQGPNDKSESMAQHTFNTTATAGTECSYWDASRALYHQLLLTATRSDEPFNLNILVSGTELLHLEIKGTITLKFQESKMMPWNR